MSFELHAKVAEEIDVEMCSYWQLSKVQVLSDLDLDLGSGQSHTNIHSTCRTTSLPNRVTVASRSTEIWPLSPLVNDIMASATRDPLPSQRALMLSLRR